MTATKVGTLSGSTISGTPATEESFTLDALGNWPNYVTKAAGTTNLNQTRTVNAANEITGVAASVGTTWATPAYDAAGNMTTIPKPAALSSSFTATYDAWNRLVKLVNTSTSQTVQQNQYDGRSFRTVILSYTSGTLSETRHSYFTDDWRCVEERVGTATTADRQFVWGDRYIDDLILRDSGSQRIYALQDDNWNVTTIVDTSGVPQERYSYSSYGNPTYLTGSFGARSSSSLSWEILYGGYRFDSGTQLFDVRYRKYHASMGMWVSRDPIGFLGQDLNLYRYSESDPTNTVDPEGLQAGGVRPAPAGGMRSAPARGVFGPCPPPPRWWREGSVMDRLFPYPGSGGITGGWPKVAKQLPPKGQRAPTAPNVQTPGRVRSPIPPEPMLKRYREGKGGRWGGREVRDLNDEIASGMEDLGNNINKGAGRGSEEYIPPATPKKGSTKDGTYVDMTGTARDGTTFRIQTIDTYADGTPKPHEADAIKRILNSFPNDTLIIIPKNSKFPPTVHLPAELH